MNATHLYPYFASAAVPAGEAAVQIAADVAEACAELRDQSLQVQVGAMPAPLARRIQA
jgi:hypothetical protein